MTTQEIIEKLEAEINSTGVLGIYIGTLVAKLEFAERSGSNALRNLQTAYETMGNDTMAGLAKAELKTFKDVLQ